MPEPIGRKRYLALSLLLALAVVIFWQVSLNVGILPARSETAILLFTLSTLVSLTFLVFAFILTRNILKLFVERRANQLGSKFKTKLVIGALALSMLPVCLQFYFSYVLMNRTLNRWFSVPFETMTRDVRSTFVEITAYANRETESDAFAIVLGPIGEALRAGRPDAVTALLTPEALREGLDFLAVEDASGPLGKFSGDGIDLGTALDRQFTPAERHTHAPLARFVAAAGADYSVAIVPVEPNRPSGPAGWVIGGNRLPEGLNAHLAEMNRQEHSYNLLYQENKTFRAIFLALMALVTILILLAATWVALFLSKQVTLPIQALAEATHQAGLGNLDYRIKARATDELGALVRSFNNMMAQLEESGAELERRRRETEAILESIPTPVISLARDRRVVRVNPAVARMFGAERAAAPSLRDLLSPEELRDVDHLLRRSLRQGLATGPLELTTSQGRISVAVTVSALRGGQRIASDIAYIVVMEDLSDLIHAQQAEAWQEVARHVAHEIKNPLTPIALSAERIRRRLEHLAPSGKNDSLQVIADSAGLIEQEVGTLKTLVDEFAQLARFPKAHLKPEYLNPIVENALAVFDGRLDGVQLRLDLTPDLPQVKMDAEQIKRVIVNLVDNAADAMEPCLFKELRISTARVGGGEFVEIAIADTGPGITAEAKEKLFLPYFSTKKRGTGLGLAIVNRIIAEHRGTIRVEENNPVGARFILELPL